MYLGGSMHLDKSAICWRYKYFSLTMLQQVKGRQTDRDSLVHTCKLFVYLLTYLLTLLRSNCLLLLSFLPWSYAYVGIRRSLLRNPTSCNSPTGMVGSINTTASARNPVRYVMSTSRYAGSSSMHSNIKGNMSTAPDIDWSASTPCPSGISWGYSAVHTHYRTQTLSLLCMTL
ncbi:hypothetical protein GGR53DRAFT_10008 [Hypoxylon sp. FL1150]|nr:hypothetical protein GGR53DRAFT_10008 [Hypoxylon sp. FL1150]